jgi:hypothetical protein
MEGENQILQGKNANAFGNKRFKGLTPETW